MIRMSWLPAPAKPHAAETSGRLSRSPKALVRLPIKWALANDPRVRSGLDAGGRHLEDAALPGIPRNHHHHHSVPRSVTDASVATRAHCGIA